MHCWSEIKSDLEPSYIEIDQRELSFYPGKTARRIQEFLNIGNTGEIESFLRAQSAQIPTSWDSGGYIPLRDTGWDAAQRRRFSDICGDLMAAFNYPLEEPKRARPGGQLDLASAPLCGLWRVEHGNRWIVTEGPGIQLHPNRPDPGAPPATLRFVGALEPGRYRFDGEVTVFNDRCSRHRLVLSVSGGGPRLCGRLDLDGTRVGQVQWEIASIEVCERSDVVIEIVLDESSTTSNFSGAKLASATFTPG